MRTQPRLSGRSTISGQEISGDGNWVAFFSDSDNIVPNDTNLAGDVFLFNRLTGAITLVSHKNAGGGDAFRGSFYSSISDDGRFVGFVSSSDITGENPGFANAAYLYDRLADQSVLASRTLAGGAADVFNNVPDYLGLASVSGEQPPSPPR